MNKVSSNIKMKYKTGIFIGKFYPLHFGHLSTINSMEKRCENVYVIFYYDKNTERLIQEIDNFNYPIKKRIEDAKKILSYNSNIKVIRIDAQEHTKFPQNKVFIKTEIQKIVKDNLDVQYIGSDEEHIYKEHIYADNYETSTSPIKNPDNLCAILHATDIRRNFERYKKHLPQIIRERFETQNNNNNNN